MIIRRTVASLALGSSKAVVRNATRNRGFATQIDILNDNVPSSNGSSKETATAQTQSTEPEESRGAQRLRRLKESLEAKRIAELSFKQDFVDAKIKKKYYNSLGSKVERQYEPFELITKPSAPADITLELLLASQAHLGHATSLWNPANQRYIFGIRQGIHIISLDAIAAHLRRAAKIVRGVTWRGGIVLFVGTRPGMDRAVIEAAKRSGGYHIFERWVPGTISNRQHLLSTGKIAVINPLDKPIHISKGEQAAVKPDLVICLNPLENLTMLHECGLHRIPTIGIIDTDCDPACVTYPIPGNDDSTRAVQFIAGVLGRAGQEGKLERYRTTEEALKQRQYATNSQLAQIPEGSRY